MKYENKEIKTDKDTGKAEEHDFMFPHFPAPITVRAKNIEEAQEKFKKIISNQEK